MRQRTANLLASGLVAVTLATIVATLLLEGLAAGVNDGLPVVLEAAPMFAFSLVGALLLHRRPEHPIGWLVAATGASNIVALAATQLTDVAGRVGWGDTDVLALVALGGELVQEVSLLLTFALLPVLFPTGRVHAPRWRWLPRTAIALAAVSVLVVPFVPDVDESGVSTNPIGIESLRGPLELIALVTFLASLLLAFPAIAALVSRYRAAEGIERLQLRWFTLSLVVLAVSFATILAWVGLWNLGVASNPSELTFDLVVITPMMGMPLSIAAAVLRYRLYDVERVLSRTVSYALLSLVLAAVYVGVVLTTQAVLGQRGDAPDVVVAGATLLAAALFQPLRHQVQRSVDRRFARHRYDGAVLASGFAARLRDTVRFDQVSDELGVVVHTALAPTTASLWVSHARPDEGTAT